MESETRQIITRLTPLAELLAIVDAQVKPVAPRNVDLDTAFGTTLAADVIAPVRPKTPIAILDGWALAAETTIGAGGYSPMLLPAVPPRVDVGQPMPPGADCVAPLDAVKVTAGRAEVLGTINPGDGVLPAGGDCDGHVPLRRKGDVVRLTDMTALCAAGVTQVSALAARIVVLPLRDDAIMADIVQFLGADMVGTALPEQANCGCDLATALAMDSVDAVVAVGGTGQGRDDRSVLTLANKGRLVVHGVALSPGETTAFGFAGGKPVLLLPGRLDAALAVWLTVGRRMLGRLTGGAASESAETVTLSRKIASTVGLAEVIPLRRAGELVEPLATKYLSFTALAHSHGWLLVPADSEGYSAGAQVEMRPWP
jgi:molybdopterin molybdotransferase